MGLVPLLVLPLLGLVPLLPLLGLVPGNSTSTCGFLLQ
jgi:hypothetical protein